MVRPATLPPQFGINIDPGAHSIPLALDLAQLADENGVDFVGIQDHPYNGGFLDTWTLLSFLAARTSRVRFLTNVASLPLRPPAVLAKSAASLDLLTNGRVELGLGAGAMWDGIAGYGGPRRTPGEAVDALEEAIQVTHLIWGRKGTGQPVSFAGRFYSLDAAQPGPQPAHNIGIWLGALKPRMLELTGRLADGLAISHNWLPPEQVPEVQRIIDESAQAAGRDVNAIRRLYNLMGVITQPGQHVRARRPAYMNGSVSEWAETIVRYYVELGMDTFTFWPIGGNEREQSLLFAQDVVSSVRQMLDGKVAF